MAQPAGDQYWYLKVLGLHCDGTNGSTTFTDVKGKTVTAYGNAQISTAQYPSLTGKTSSAYFDGTGDYLTLADSADWAFGSGDFSIRCFFKQAATGGTYALLAQRTTTTSSYSFSFQITGSTITFICSTSGTATTHTATVAYTQETSNWHFAEVVRSGTSLIVFIDGTAGTPVSISPSALFDSADVLSIGGDTTGSSNQFNGYLSEIEIYKGVAVNTVGYTPPTAPFQDEYVSVSGTTKDSSGNFASMLVRVYHRDSGSYVGEVVSNPTTGAWQILTTKVGKHQAIAVPATKAITYNKRLAIPFSGDNNSRNFTDLVGAAVRPVGESKIVTTQTDPFGGSSGVLYLASASDSVSVARAIDGIGSTGDFHIRCWVRPTTFPDSTTLFFTSTNGYQWQRNGANNLGIAKVGVAWYFYASSNPTLNAWTYVQLRRSGTTLAIYYGSTLVGSATNSETFDVSTTAGIFGIWTGYACDFEFLQYADSVTPPTTRLSGFGSTTENALIYDDITPY